MELLEAIHTRRSVRKFKPEPVSEDLITELLKAAMTAPSAGNQQPWHFIVITDRDILDKVPSIHPFASMSRQAQAAILVCGDPSLEKYAGFWVQDCSAAIQNLLLAARGLGLGAVWTGIHPVVERVAAFRVLFGLPEEIIPLAFIPVGYTDQPQNSLDRFRPERVRRDKW